MAGKAGGNAAQVALQILARQKKVAERALAGKPQRGAARKLRRDAARTQWILDDTSDHISLAKFMQREAGNEKTL